MGLGCAVVVAVTDELHQMCKSKSTRFVYLRDFFCVVEVIWV